MISESTTGYNMENIETTEKPEDPIFALSSSKYF